MYLFTGPWNIQEKPKGFQEKNFVRRYIDGNCIFAQLIGFDGLN